MPRVPEYQSDVAARPAYQADLAANATPGAFGAGVGAGMQQLGAGGANLADALEQVRALEDETYVRERRNEYMRERDALMYDPETGYLNTQGKTALDQRPAFVEGMRKLREKYASGLSGNRQRLFTQSIEPLELDAQRSAMIHNGTQLKQFVVDQGKAAAENFQNEALRNVRNPAMADKYTMAAINELREVGRKQGWSAEEFQSREAAFLSDTTVKAATQLAVSDPLAADAYVKRNADRLTPEDKTKLDAALKEPVLAAKAQRNVASLVTGVPVPDYSKVTIPADDQTVTAGKATPGQFSRATSGNLAVVGKMIGMSETGDRGAISQFIQRSAGIKIDPAVTPWCAAFVNGVLGAQGIAGTGKLNARSFLSFGVATDTPKPGDIVVLRRGNSETQGHVGFFQGFDGNGNIMVAGGNQGNRVSVATFPKALLLGFRTTGGAVSGQVAQLPTYNPDGLAHLYAEAAKIADPQERQATLKAMETYYQTQKKALDASREDAERQVSQLIIQDPTTDLLTLPQPVRDALGADGMTTAMNLQEKVRNYGDVRTDDMTLAELGDAYARDPEAFAELPLFQYRDKLSRSDWGKVMEWQRTAKTDKRKAAEDAVTMSGAFSTIKTQLEAVGLTTTGLGQRDRGEREAMSGRIAKFQNSLGGLIDEFKRENDGRNPSAPEIQAMVNRLLLPVVITTPGTFWNSTRDAFAFEAQSRPDGSTVDVVVKYDDIPIDMRRKIGDELERDLGRKPSSEEVVSEYENFVLNR